MAAQSSSHDVRALYREMQHERATERRPLLPKYHVHPGDLALAVLLAAIVGVLCQLQFDWIGALQSWL
jgi:hypothetical protein